MDEAPKLKLLSPKEPIDLDAWRAPNPIEDIAKQKQDEDPEKPKQRTPSMSDELTKTLIEKVEQKSDMQNRLVEERLNAGFDKIDQRIDLLTKNFEQRIDMHTQRFEQRMDLLTKNFEQRMDLHTQNFEQRMDLHTQKIVEQNQLLSDRLAAHQNDIQEIRQDGKSTRKTVVVTGITSVIAIVCGLGALGYVFIQSLQASNQAWLMKALDLIQKIPPSP